MVQAYWNKDQELKQVQAARSNLHDLTLLAVPLGDTAGPATDAEGMPHWLTHGERERVEMDSYDLDSENTKMGGSFYMLLQYLNVDVARLREHAPELYARVLKRRMTRRTTHSCLTWSDKRPARPRAGRTRRG